MGRSLVNAGELHVKVKDRVSIDPNFNIEKFNIDFSKDISKIKDDFKYNFTDPTKIPGTLNINLTNDKKLQFSINDKPIQVERTDGTKSELGESITDPTITVDKISEGLSKAYTEAGFGFPSLNKTNFELDIRSSPSRNINADNIGLADAINRSEVKNADVAYQNGKDSFNNSTEAKNIKSDIEKIKTEYDKLSDADKQKFQDNLEKSNKTNSENTGDSKNRVKSFMKWSAIFAAVAAGGFGLYEYIEQHRKEMSGCWQYKSDGTTSTKGKVYDLTCDQSYKTGTPVLLGTVCSIDSDLNSQNSGYCKCIGGAEGNQNKTSNGCGVKCETPDTSYCSSWCKDNNRITIDTIYTYSYECTEATSLDAIGDISNNVLDALKNVVPTASNIFSNFFKIIGNILKIGGIIILIIIAIYLVYYLYKLYTKVKPTPESLPASSLPTSSSL